MTPLNVQTDTTALPLGGISLPSSGSLADGETICLPGWKPRKVCSGYLDDVGWRVGMGGLCSMLHIKMLQLTIVQRLKRTHNGSKGTLTHLTAGVRLRLSRERQGRGGAFRDFVRHSRAAPPFFSSVCRIQSRLCLSRIVFSPTKTLSASLRKQVSSVFCLFSLPYRSHFQGWCRHRGDDQAHRQVQERLHRLSRVWDPVHP